MNNYELTARRKITLYAVNKFLVTRNSAYSNFSGNDTIDTSDTNTIVCCEF